MSVDAYSEGIPLAEALGVFSAPEKWDEYKHLVSKGYDHRFVSALGAPETEDDRLYYKCSSLHKSLLADFNAKLQSGEIVATALDSRNPIDAPRTRIPSEAWRFLEPDFEKSTASGEGFAFAGVLVRERTERKSTVRAGTECRKWLKQLRATKAGPFKKSELWAEAKQRFGISLSQREFERAWTACAPKKWKRPGRKSKRRIDTPK